MTIKTGILHPGEMGISLAASAINSGNHVFWCTQGRSLETRNRAEQVKLTSLPTLQALCDTCEIIISVCPPHAAVEQAEQVAACNYRGLYADVNAVSPDTVRHIGSIIGNAGIGFVDGGIIGMPAWQPGTTWLHLSGTEAGRIAECFAGGPLETSVLGDEIGQASGLKMCFAANSKGTAAMHTAILAAAESMGVRSALENQWDILTPGFREKSQGRIRSVARKSWRFTGEMKEIATTLESVGMPAEFHLGAAEIYARQTRFKGVETDPTIEEILEEVIKTPGTTSTNTE